MSKLLKIVQPWLHDDDSDDILRLRDQLIWLQRELFSEYEPNRYENFDDRLAIWLENLSNETDKKDLFRLLDHLFFIGKQQFDSLCRAAYSDQTVRWIIDRGNLDIQSPSISSEIDVLTSDTWFCPITDSMRINSFLKLNNLRGHDNRPDWRSLEIFADPHKLKSYVHHENIKRLVLLEDFVGSGSQMKSSVAFAAMTLPHIDILVIPLVCCPEGVATGNALSSSFTNITFSPTLTLRPELFLCENAVSGEPPVFSRVRDIILQISARLGIWKDEPFGFEKTGALVALYSNCPDNSLPIIHANGTPWAPLFSRIRRS